MKRLVFALCVLLTLGCASWEKQLLSYWEGKHQDELIAYFGEPEWEEPLPEGGRRLIYREWLQREVCQYDVTTDEQGIIRSISDSCF